MKVLERYLANEEETQAFGRLCAKCAVQGALIFLQGQLGAGKTTLVRGFLSEMGHTGAVKSPTYALIESYSTPSGPLHHLDLYRLADPDELEWMGMRDFLDGKQTCLIEWPEQGKGWLPDADLVIELTLKDDGRRVRAESVSDVGKRILENAIQREE